MTRTDVTFRSGDEQCGAWLYTPSDTPTTPRERPIVVMAHGLGGLKEEGLAPFAERFCAAGYLCLVFDYRHFGASGGQPRHLLSIAKQREDWKAAVAFARTLDGVDPDRVVLWGTSFAGGHVIVTAAQDPRVVAAISQCPFTDGLASSRAIPPLTSLKVTARAVRDVIAARLGRLPVMVPTYGPPGSTALMTAPDVVEGIEKLAFGEPAPRDVTARFAFDIITSFPGRQVADVTCPILFALCDPDTVAPSGPSRKYAEQAPRGEIKTYAAGHFGIYVEEPFELNVADQLDFLARHVPIN